MSQLCTLHPTSTGCIFRTEFVFSLWFLFTLSNLLFPRAPLGGRLWSWSAVAVSCRSVLRNERNFFHFLSVVTAFQILSVVLYSQMKKHSIDKVPRVEFVELQPAFGLVRRRLVKMWLRSHMLHRLLVLSARINNVIIPGLRFSCDGYMYLLYEH